MIFVKSFPRIYCVGIILIVLFYGIGFYFGEDAVGGTKLDFFSFHYPGIQFFKENKFVVAIQDYPSATTPFFYVFNAYINPFSESIMGLRISNMFIALFTGALFFYLIKQKYNALDSLSILLLGSLFLVSPYTKSIAIWPITDNIPYLFLFISLLLFNKLEENQSKKRYFLISMIAITVALAFYTRQMYLVFSVYFFFKILHLYHWEKKIIMFTLAVFSISVLPLGYLFLQWHGLNPPMFNHQKAFNLNSIPYIFQFIVFYATPIILFVLYNYEWKKLTKKKLLEYVIVIGVYIALFIDFSFYQKGGGVIQKIALLIFSKNIPLGELFFLFYSSIGVLFSYILVREKFENIILIAPLLFFITTEHISQKYADPMIIIVLLLFLNTKLTDTFKDKVLVRFQFMYNFAFYIFALAYYNLN